jgi:hypothetical protein
MLRRTCKRGSMLICLVVVAVVLTGCAPSSTTTRSQPTSLEQRYAQEIEQLIYRAQTSGKSVREQIRYILQERARFPDRLFFDMYVSNKGMHYLKDVFFASQPIVLITKDVVSKKEVLGNNMMNIDTVAVYGSVAYTGEPLIALDGNYRGFLTHSTLTRPPATLEPSEAANREIFGSARDFFVEKGLNNYGELRTDTPPASLPGAYKVCEYIDSYEKRSGVLPNMYDVAENWAVENPVQATLIALGVSGILSNTNR